MTHTAPPAPAIYALTLSAKFGNGYDKPASAGLDVVAKPHRIM
jgi:hypothetical protein